MLVMFECTVVVQRQRNLRELRSLQTPKQRLQAYRGGKWEVRRLLFIYMKISISKAAGQWRQQVNVQCRAASMALWFSFGLVHK